MEVDAPPEPPPPPPPPPKPTHRERVLLAAAADVSPRSVDHAYEPDRPIRETTFARVERAAIELGFSLPPPRRGAKP